MKHSYVQYSYYNNSTIILYAQMSLLCSTLCQHNVHWPKQHRYTGLLCCLYLCTLCQHNVHRYKQHSKIPVDIQDTLNEQIFPAFRKVG